MHSVLVSTFFFAAVVTSVHATLLPGVTGQECEGTTGVFCAEGLVCVKETPELPQSPGLCYPPSRISNVGGSCYGFTRLPKVCASGLVCFMKRIGTDMPGKCQLRTAKEGERCMEYSPWSKNCAKGLTCKLDHPEVTDLGGVCVQEDTSLEGALGAKCGGDNRLKCQSNLFCKREARDIVNSTGVCTEVSAYASPEGGMCGGPENLQCSPGLTCKDMMSIYMDGYQTCVGSEMDEGVVEATVQSSDLSNEGSKKLGQLGGMCGGIAGIQCAHGLTCHMTAHHPDASGTCINNTQQGGLSGLGQSCEGLLRLTCKKGLFCFKKNLRYYPATGSCASVVDHRSQLNQMCGGKENVKCAPKLKCTKMINIYMDGYGLCKQSTEEDNNNDDA